MAAVAAVIASTYHPFYYRASTSRGADLFERDYAEPLAFQREFATRRSHWILPYPDIAA
jgi:hypothetical protein